MTVSTEDERALWIRRFHPSPMADTRLVCFPHAGGSASYYFAVSRALSPNAEVLALQYPGRQERRREPLVDDLHVLADRIADVLDDSARTRLSFFGHSMGASLAFETARRLEARGVVLDTLFVSGRRAPTAFRDERVHLESDAGLLNEMRRLSGTDSRVFEDEELMRMALPLIRNDYRAAETYRGEPGSEVSCDIVTLVGESDPKVTLPEAEKWREHTSGRFDMRTYPGGHFYLVDHRDEVNRVLAERLAATPQH
jgi:pyochelin biosynthetic protein PchC